MSVIKKNILANFGGSLWTGLMSLVFIPIYIRFMGIEAYGLVGVFAALLALFSLLDMGLGSTLNREMARLAVQENKAQEMRDMLRTLEIPYWIVALLIGSSVVALSPLIAYHWIKAEALSPATIQRAVMIMGFATAFQWPLGFYGGGLMGLQRQFLLNSVNAIMATLRGLGAVLILWLISPTVEAFFLWQIVVSAVHTGLVAYLLWHSLPKAIGKPQFRWDLARSVWRFASGVTGITVLSTILMQLDKVILSRVLSLEMFGYYGLANVVAMNLYRFVYPVASATFPRMVNLVAIGDWEELAKLYHRSAQLVSVLVLPFAIVIAVFSEEILFLWTQNHVTVQRTHLLVSILITGTALNGLMNIPYNLQLACGWTRLTLFANFLSVLVLVPLMIVLGVFYGAVGAATVWLILNGGYILFVVQIMHRRLIPNEKWQWYAEDIGMPAMVSLMVVGAFRLLAPIPSDTLQLFAYLALASVVTFGATAMATPVTRKWFRDQVVKLRVFCAANS